MPEIKDYIGYVIAILAILIPVIVVLVAFVWRIALRVQQAHTMAEAAREAVAEFKSDLQEVATTNKASADGITQRLDQLINTLLNAK